MTTYAQTVVLSYLNLNASATHDEIHYAVRNHPITDEELCGALVTLVSAKVVGLTSIASLFYLV